MHLNDDQIQDYLDGNISPDDPVVLHLKECADCKKAVEDYGVLFRSLEVDPGFSLSPEFAEKVISSLPQPGAAPVPEKPEWFKVREWVIMVAGLAVVVVTSLFFINPISLLESLFGWAGQPAASGGSIAQDMSSYVSGLGFNPTLVLFVVLTIITIAVVDRIVIRQRMRRRAVSIFV